ncbi:MAG: glycosyltransferase family 4 protein [Rhodospirillaceae bacterium]
MTPVWLFLAATLGAAVATGVVTHILRRRAILDHPNERSSHAVPTPRGGGWGILPIMLPGWALFGVDPRLLAGLALLAAVSWVDDRRNLSPGPRLLAQAVAVALGLAALGPEPVFQGWLPSGLDLVLAGLCWLWFLNLFNFMDGIDGLAGSEAVSIAAGLALVAPGAGAPGALLAGAAFGFLIWNWQPAKVFMGDVGSIPLGYGLGWLLLTTTQTEAWPAAVLLPLYFITDASITLVRRALAGKPVLQAHREHFYQRAVQGGVSHAAVVCSVIVTNGVLIGLALAVPALGAVPALAGGALTVAALLYRLQRAAEKTP